MQKGFTLMETVVVIGLLVVIGLTGGLFWGNRALISQEFDRAYSIIRNEMARAQIDTLLGSQDNAWGVAFLGNQLTRFKGTTYATRMPAFDVITTFPVAITITAPSEINFTRPEGLPNASAIVTITDGLRIHTISINTAGAISIE